MPSIVTTGIIRAGRVEVAEPIDLPDGSEVTILAQANGKRVDAHDDRPMTSAEIRDTLEAMSKLEPFEMTDEERAAAEAWEKKLKEYSIATMDRGIEDVFR